MKLSQEAIAREGAVASQVVGVSTRQSKTDKRCLLRPHMGASLKSTRHGISRDLIFQFMLSNAKSVGHKVSIICVLIMDEPPLLLLRRALHITPL